MKTIASRLTDLREKNDWTKTEVAKKLGLTAVSTYANWEYGSREPHAEMIAEIADVYGVTTDYIIKGTNMSKNTDAPTDIALKISQLIQYIQTQDPEDLLFHGKSLSESQINLLVPALKVALALTENEA